jgi:hypothetical protein
MPTYPQQVSTAKGITAAFVRAGSSIIPSHTQSYTAKS